MGIDRGDVEKLEIETRNEAGELADPTKLVLRIMQPDGVELVREWPIEGSEITQVETGVFRSDLQLSQFGEWKARWEATGAVEVSEPDSVYVVPDSFAQPITARIITLSEFRPSKRSDGVAWAKARIEQSGSPDQGWEELKTVTLEPVDEDPTDPALRSFTVEASKAWLRIVFLDGEEKKDAPSPVVSLLGAPFRPPIRQVSAILRARTYAVGSDEETGGDLVGEFTAGTWPTAEEVEDTLIPQACVDVERATGRVPGELLEEARRVAALRTASEIERSYIPEQADETHTIFQTLRKSFEEELATLNGNLWQWTLANRGVT